VRTVAQAEQAGAGNIEEGKREMMFELYRALNQWLIQRGTKDAVFARAYLDSTWNLICRSENTATVCHKYLIWQLDTLGIPFAHKRYCYTNPLDPVVCIITSVFEYISCFPHILEDPVLYSQGMTNLVMFLTYLSQCWKHMRWRSMQWDMTSTT
jgi:hypothetical protein